MYKIVSYMCHNFTCVYLVALKKEEKRSMGSSSTAALNPGPEEDLDGAAALGMTSQLDVQPCGS